MQDFASEIDAGSKTRGLNVDDLAFTATRRPNSGPRTRKRPEAPQRSEEAYQAFTAADAAGNGVLTRDEFAKAYVAGQFENHLNGVVSNPVDPPNFVSASPGHLGAYNRSASPSRGGMGLAEARRMANARKQVEDDALRTAQLAEEAQVQAQAQAQRGLNQGRGTAGGREAADVEVEIENIRAQAQAKAEEERAKVEDDRSRYMAQAQFTVSTHLRQLSPFEPKNAFLLVLGWISYLTVMDVLRNLGMVT